MLFRLFLNKLKVGNSNAYLFRNICQINSTPFILLYNEINFKTSKYHVLSLRKFSTCVVLKLNERFSRISKHDKILTIPNALTVSRIAMTPILSYLIINNNLTLSFGIFILAGITDLLDGYIARNMNQASAFGSFLDPLADKLLIASTFISLSILGLIPIPLTILIFLRDIILIIAGFYIRFISLPPPKTIYKYFNPTYATVQLNPTLVSKWNTALQLSLVGLTLSSDLFNINETVLQALWFLTASTTIASGIQYIFAKDTFKIFENVRKQRKDK